jgi:hypothetical protein
MWDIDDTWSDAGNLEFGKREVLGNMHDRIALSSIYYIPKKHMVVSVVDIGWYTDDST